MVMTIRRKYDTNQICLKVRNECGIERDRERGQVRRPSKGKASKGGREKKKKKNFFGGVGG